MTLSRRRFLELTAAGLAVAAAGCADDQGSVGDTAATDPRPDTDGVDDTQVADTDTVPTIPHWDEYGLERLYRDDADGVPRPVHWTRGDGSGELWIELPTRSVALASPSTGEVRTAFADVGSDALVDEVARTFGPLVADELRSSLALLT